MKLEFVSKKEKADEGRRFVRAEYSIGGYAVAVLDTFYSDGTSRREISCRALERGRYLPEIYYRDTWYGEEASFFEIQTTSYSALDMAEFGKFVEAQRVAIEVVETLNREFCGKEG